MKKEQFAHRETSQLLGMLDEAARRSGRSRGQCFEDFLNIAVCTLSGGEMEEQYLRVVAGYSEAEKGKRGIDTLATMFATLIGIMDDTRQDILGDLFQGAITYGEAGQYLTPDSIADLMARLTGSERDGETVSDPCCGTGRMLLAAARVNRHREFIGQDIDLRCVRITAINMGLHNLYGYVIWGNSLLPHEQRLVYRTGFNGKGVIREVPLAKAPAPLSAVQEEQAPQKEAPSSAEEQRPEAETALPQLPSKPTQGMLFEEEGE